MNQKEQNPKTDRFVCKSAEISVPGVGRTTHGITVCAALKGTESNGILLFEEGNETPLRVDFPEDCRVGNMYSLIVSGSFSEGMTYLFHEDGEPLFDPYATSFTGHRLFGDEHFKAGKKDSLGNCVIPSAKKPKALPFKELPLSQSIYYRMHVRGFTADSSSGLKKEEAGTFEGMRKKIPYLQQLGITGVILQPVYEFEECMVPKGNVPAREAYKVNYWGYLPGYYCAPKNAYAASGNAVTEFQKLVNDLHKAGISVILQFFFEDKAPLRMMEDVLTHWVKTYRVDGFEILGASVPVKALASSPYLAGSRLFFGSEAEYALQSEDENAVAKYRRGSSAGIKDERRLACFSRDYERAMRCFLKGDRGCVPEFFGAIRRNGSGYGILCQLAGYQGFRLYDLVSYNEKHNHANGEDNCDGETENLSWNCGEEGPTKKRSVQVLRDRQVRNALAFLFTSQGTPVLFMGDECGKTGGGNNNPWCQDNAVVYLQWNLKKREKEILSFARKMIAFRKESGLFSMPAGARMMDTLSCGYPDLSAHGKEAWKPDMGYDSEAVGILLWAPYQQAEGDGEGSLHIVYNMLWQSDEFALPGLPKGLTWKPVLTSGDGKKEVMPEKTETENKVRAEERSVLILRAEKE